MADFITFLIREGLRSIEGIIGTMAAMVTIVSPFIKVRDQKKASYKKMRKAIQIIAVSVFVVSVVLLVLTYIGSVVVEQVALDHSNLTLKAGDTETLLPLFYIPITAPIIVLYGQQAMKQSPVWMKTGWLLLLRLGQRLSLRRPVKIMQQKVLPAQSRCAVNQRGTLLCLVRTACVCRKRSMYISPLMKMTLPKSMSLPDLHPARSLIDCLVKKDTSLTPRQAYGQFMRP